MTLERDLNDAVERFSGFLKTERSASVHTVRGYMTDLDGFRAYLETLPGLGTSGLAAIDRMDDPTREGHFSTAQAYLQELHGSMG